MRRALMVLGIGAVSLTVAAPAVAEETGPDTTACVQSFDAGQKLRREGELIAAKQELLACAQPQCPDVIEQKCGAWLAEVEASIPSLVLVVPAGTSPQGIVVSIDGELRNDALNGRPIELDPGSHLVRYHKDDSPPREQTVVVAEGEQRKRVLLEIEVAETTVAPSGPTMAAPRPVEASNDGVSPLVWIGFGVAGVGAIVGAITGGLALSKASELEERCLDKRCTAAEQSTFDRGNALAHGSTASFAIAGVGAVVGIVGLIVSGGGAEQASLTPLVGPGFLGLGGRF